MCSLGKIEGVMVLECTSVIEECYERPLDVKRSKEVGKQVSPRAYT